ncbi:MAG: hypothetical protein AAFU85_04875 [Planctomycetota bacterium]
MCRHIRVSDRVGRYVQVALMVAIAIGLTSRSAEAQYFYYGRRAVVARPVLPAPPPVFYGPTAIHSGPGSFSIRSPFFSFRVDAPYPPVYGYRTYSSFPVPAYRYEPALPAYPTPTLRYSTPIPDQVPGAIGSVSPAPLYSPGLSGGIPDLTDPAPIITARPRLEDAATSHSGRGLSDSANRLRSALSSRTDDADVWLEYLQPGAIASAANSGRLTPDIVALEQRYEGVTMNPRLRSITRLPGFERTRMLLGQWIRSAAPEPAAESFVPADSPKPMESPIGSSGSRPADGRSELPSGLPTAGSGVEPATGSTDEPSDVGGATKAEPTPEVIETLPEPIKDNDV